MKNFRRSNVMSKWIRHLYLLSMMLLLIGGTALAQQKTVTGKVTDESGTPLPGVTVLEAGTTNGILTDDNGEFSLEVSEKGSLEISFFGFSTQKISVAGQSNFNVSMTEGVVLDDVVITALGIAKDERAIGYSVESINGDALAQASEPNILNALQGKIAGVQIGSGNTVAGGTTRITIRGNNSLKQGKNQPLIIVDGVAMENSIQGPGASSLLGNTSGRDWGSGINNINSWDIEEMTVLKGPTAAALYGSRGANGVIIITTKKGKKGKGIGIEFNTSQIITEAWKFREVQNEFGEGSASPSSQEFEQNDQGQNLLPRVGFWGSGVSYGPKMDGTPVLWWNGETLPFEPQPDNVKNFFQNGRNSTYNIAFSGASDVGSVRASLTRNEMTAITPNTNREQNTINLNTSLNVTERLTASAAISYMDNRAKNSPVLGSSEASIGKNASYNWGRSYRPNLERDNIYNPDGTLAPAGVGYPANNALGRGRGRTGSFFWNVFENNEWRNRDRLLGSLSLDLEVLPWLHLVGQLGLDNYNDDNEAKNKPRDTDGLIGGRYSHSLSRNRIQDHKIYLSGQKDLTSDINLSFNLGAHHWSRSFYSISGKNGNRNFVDPWLYSFKNVDYPGSIGTNYANNQLLPGESKYEKEINGIYGSVDLAYKNMLYLTVTGRNDWSSTLPSNANSYFYPSAALGFVFTELGGLTDNSLLSFGKLRLAYAQTANDTDPYELEPTFSRGTFGGQATAGVRNVIPPLNLAPEETRSYDIGLDLRFLNGRINLDFTYYYISATNQILQSPLPVSSGFSALRFNTGEVENRGVELLISGTPVSTRDFSWEIGFNMSSNRNKVVSLAEGAESLTLGGIFGGHGPSIEARPGERYGTIMGWDFVYFDKNGNEMIDEAEKIPSNRIISDDGVWYEITSERVPVGNVTPDFTGGVFNTVKWKNFSLNALVDMKIGGDVFFYDHAVGNAFGQSIESLEGRDAEHGGLPYTDANGVTRNIGLVKEGVYADGTPNDIVVPYYRKHQEYFTWGAGSAAISQSVFDGSWVRLRELSVTYGMPKSLVDDIGFINNLSLTLLGRNLWFLLNNAPHNLDPSLTMGSGVSAGGIQNSALPSTRSYGAILKVGF